jgi:hypothetical protein
VASRLRAVPSAVLGTNEVTPLEMAGAYATLAAGGRRAAPFGVRRITGPDGRVLYQARPEGDQVPAPGVAAIATECSGRWSTTAPGRGAGPDRPAGGRQDRHHQGPCRRLVRGLHPDPGHGRVVGYPQGQVTVDGEAAPGTVLAQSPAGGTARPAGTPVTLTVAVDAQGAGGLG